MIIMADILDLFKVCEKEQASNKIGTFINRHIKSKTMRMRMHNDDDDDRIDMGIVMNMIN